MQENQVTLVDQMYAWGQGESALYSHCHDFYDWFCSDASLERRAKALQNKVIKLVNYFREKGNPIDCIRCMYSLRITAQWVDRSMIHSLSAIANRAMCSIG